MKGRREESQISAMYKRLETESDHEIFESLKRSHVYIGARYVKLCSVSKMCSKGKCRVIPFYVLRAFVCMVHEA